MSKRFRRVIAAVYNTPWAILPEKLQAIREVLALRSQGMRFTREEIAARVGNKSSRTPIVGQGQVAVLNIFGTISPRLSAMQDASGGVSAEAIARAFREAVNSADVSAIVLNFDSPGGSVGGIQELAQLVYESRSKKRIVAVANGMMASAAYWFGSAAHEIVATPSATDIGSYGVITIHQDDTEQLKMKGIEETVIASTEFKAEQWGPMTESLKARMQSRVNQISDRFGEDLARNRGVTRAVIEKKYGQGRALLAEEALAAGMVDRIATLETVLAELGAVAGSGSDATTEAVQPANRFGAVTEGVIEMNFEQWCLSHGCTVDKMNAAQVAMMRGLFDAIAKGTQMEASVVSRQISTIMGGQSLETTVSTTTLPGNAPPSATVVNRQVAGVTAGEIVATVRLATALSADAQITLIESLTREADSLTNATMLDRINAAVVQHTTNAGATVIQPGAAERDKFHARARDAILVRTFGSQQMAGIPGGSGMPSTIYDLASQQFIPWKPESTREYQLASLPRLAEQCLIQAGISPQIVARMSPVEHARMIMGGDLRSVGIMASEAAYNVTGMFSNIFYDATNVLLRRGYSEARTTFQVWAKRGTSITNFKPVHRVIAGELADPKAIPEDGEFEETTTIDGRETMSLTVWGEVWSQSWQTIVNDDLGAFTDVPAKQGNAMRRKQNKLTYGTLKDNGTLSDGGALFNSSAQSAAGGHNNLTTGAGAPSVSTLNTLTAKMQKQSGLLIAERTTLNLQPRYILAPPDLRGTVLTLVRSVADPASNNSGVKNIWENELEAVIDAELGSNAGGSDVAWYVAADNNEVDTVEYAFLQGLEMPAFESAITFDRLGMRHRTYQAFAVKPLDYRGLQKHAGE